MKITLSILMLTTFTLVSCYKLALHDTSVFNSKVETKNKNSEIYFDLKGDVKFIKIFDCLYENNQILLDSCQLNESVAFDKLGNETEVIAYSGENYMNYRQVLEYDKDGIYQSGITYDADDKTILRQMKPTVINGQLTKVETVDSQGRLENTATFEYNKKGNRTVVNVQGANGEVLYRKEQRYNDNNQIIEKISNGKKQFFQYDDKGNITRDKIEGNSNWREYNYIFDKQGNWTEKVITGSETAHLREIEYY